MKRLKPTHPGFTTIELLITLVLLAVLATLAGPPLVQFIRAARLSSTATQLEADLEQARREAIRLNTRVLVCPATEADVLACGSAWASGWLVCYDNDSDGSCDDPTVTGTNNPIRVHGAIELKVTLTGPASVRFNANGSQGDPNVTTPLTFTVAGEGTTKQYKATVDPAGNIALVKPS